ncbi:hypothetical protein COOONC_18580 [Cooperia oncophora]
MKVSSNEKRREVQDLTKFHGKTCALKRITFDIHRNDCFGLVGPSGAGKTTAFNIIVGLTYPSSGKVLLNNRTVRGVSKVGFCPQFDSLANTLSSYQNMIIIAGMTGYRSPRKMVMEVLRQMRMTSHCRKSVQQAEKRRISTGVAILNNAELILLDEPTAGIDPKV